MSTLPAHNTASQVIHPIPFLNLRAQYLSIKSPIDRAIQSVLLNSDFILGSRVESFERRFADYLGARHAIGVGSGTSALRFALLAAGIGFGDRVILPVNTFAATAEAIVQVGATPVFVDVRPDTALIDPAAIEAAVDDYTRAVIPVHLFGQPADMDAVLHIAQKTNLVVIEDACQAHGATYRGRPVGTFAQASCFSFYPGKNLGAYGDGGCVVTNTPALERAVRLLRNHGAETKFEHQIIGATDRLDALQAAVLEVKLAHLEEWNAARRDVAARYDRLLAEVPVQPIRQAPHRQSAHHLYVIRTSHRDQLHDYLAHRGISTGMHYPIPLHLQPAFASLGGRKGDFPVAEALADEILSLPIYPELEPGPITSITEAIADFFRNHRQ